MVAVLQRNDEMEWLSKHLLARVRRLAKNDRHGCCLALLSGREHMDLLPEKWACTGCLGIEQETELAAQTDTHPLGGENLDTGFRSANWA